MTARANGAARTCDVVLYGATGFVGCQTMAYFASHTGVKAAGLRWALAGRNRSKLDQVPSAKSAVQRCKPASWWQPAMTSKHSTNSRVVLGRAQHGRSICAVRQRAGRGLCEGGHPLC